MRQHLKRRHLDIELYSGLSVGHDVVVFPMWNLSGQMVGYQQYRPDGNKKERRNPKVGKYYTQVRKEGKTSATTAWGLDRLNMNRRRVYLVEGIFKACRFHNLGLNALAVISNDPKHLKSWLTSLGYELYSVCDGDKAGIKLAKYGNRSIILPSGVYVDEMSVSEFSDLVDALES